MRCSRLDDWTEREVLVPRLTIWLYLFTVRNQLPTRACLFMVLG